eukprot:CAMPEP_0117545092 /NCGR_PEP_ID=MMETSP0784-20121206/45916_1 /TAXON_ID=39447 /ORGANISM="" /LENGTH=723 /DNA_ID=CAMNT_0005341927 /DNA_START=19 /DNA_END=2187 /DNA_ORIENTATION=+
MSRFQGLQNLPSRTRELDYKVAHGSGPNDRTRTFLVVRRAGSSEANGVYCPCDRRWKDFDVLQNLHGECIVSREAQTSSRTGKEKHGFALGRAGRPLYGAPTEFLELPVKGWKVLQGIAPVPELEIFTTLAKACEHCARDFAEGAAEASKRGRWDAALELADRAFDCYTQSRPKGSRDKREGVTEWAAEVSEILATRADALVHQGEYRRALVDACSAVHFVPAFEWSRARARGITACLNLGVQEEQAKLLMEEACRRDIRDFPGVNELAPWVDAMLQRAIAAELRAIVLKDETPDDGRIYFRVVDPEECKIRSAASYSAKVLGGRELDDLVRGERITEDGLWFQLHAAELYDDSGGERRAFLPIFTEGSVEERDEILERCHPREYPRRPHWERLGLAVRPLGLKPPIDAEEHARWREEERPKSQQPWPYVYKHRLAVCTMLRGAPEDAIDTFVRYHWGIGFNHIFLYFDDPSDPGIPVARELEEMCLGKQVEGVSMSIIRMDSQWWARTMESSRFYQRREKSDMYDSVCTRHDKYNDVESRQMIVIDDAIMQAHGMDIDWFAPLDIDECMYVPQIHDCSARRYLGSKPRSVQCVRLLNHEAVPEQLECQDWFRDCTLFKINKYHCKGWTLEREYDELLRRREGREFEPTQEAEVAWWQELRDKVASKRLRAAQKLGSDATASAVASPSDASGDMADDIFYFNAYDSGSSIVRLEKHLRPPIPY